MGAGASAERVEELRSEFLKEDTNGDGAISMDELKEWHKKEDGDAYDDAKVEAEFNKLDANHDGRVQLNEYLQAQGVKKGVAMEIDTEESIKRAVGNEMLNAAHNGSEERAAKIEGDDAAAGADVDLTVTGSAAAAPALMDDGAMAAALAASSGRTNRRMSAVGNESAPAESRRNRRTSAVGTEADAEAAAASAANAATEAVAAE